MKILTVLIVWFLLSASANGEDIKIVTEHYPPFQIVENHKVIGGLSVDLINALLDETGVQATIEAYPWARAYHMALNQKNVLIFSITRNKQRETLFKWVGSIIGCKDAFWGLEKRKDIQIKSLADAQGYAIGVPRNDNQYEYLRSKGFSNLVVTNDYDTALKMLYKGRIELVIGVKIPLFYRLKELKLDYRKISKKYEIGQQWGDLSIAFSRSTPDEIVIKFRNALQKLKSNGMYKAIFQKWFPESF